MPTHYQTQPEQWREKERERCRLKYYRRGRPKNKVETNRKTSATFYAKYPEKAAAKQQNTNKAPRSLVSHHWSYNVEHYSDVIHVTPQQHAAIHRRIKYDAETKMYRLRATGELLDTKERHIYETYLFTGNN